MQMDRECLLNGFSPYHHPRGFHGDFVQFQQRRCSASFYPEFANCNPFEGQFYPPPAVNAQFFYQPGNGFHQFQDFQYFVVIDFEATCDQDNIPQPQEIIEFPAVLVNAMTGKLEARFQTYVRPTVNPELTDFCKDLTGIQQHQVDKGIPLSKAILYHDKWLESRGIKNTNFAIVTWSNWDCKVMLESECQYKKIPKPSYFNKWINLRVAFNQVFGGVKCNLKQAVEISGLEWRGRHHSGLDDAKNTARLLLLLMERGFKFFITDSLTDGKENYSFPLYHPEQNVKTGLHPHCYCGIKSCKRILQNVGSGEEGLCFGCGYWGTAAGARCKYFQVSF